MAKPPEEGLIWEWRAFGRISDPLSAKTRKHPIRQGICDVRGEDLYYVSPESDQNVKLRRSADGWLLKFKLLIETRGEYELYNEGADLIYEFPVSVDQLKTAGLLLGVTLARDPEPADRFTGDQFSQELEQASPPVRSTRVYKRRSQYQFDNGWVELAEVEFQCLSIESVSIHSPERQNVKAIVKELNPGQELEPMNYIAACRRWGLVNELS